MNFLDSFIEGNDELKQRMVTLDDLGQPLDNEANDVPMYDQYNRGLAVTQQDMSDRVNLSIDPRAQPRCGLTGMIPSAEEGNDAGGNATATSVNGRHGTVCAGGDSVSQAGTTQVKAGTESLKTFSSKELFEPIESTVDCIEQLSRIVCPCTLGNKQSADNGKPSISLQRMVELNALKQLKRS